MAIQQKKYTDDNISHLQEYLRLYAEQGHPVDYEILVDGMRVVLRTDKPDMFSLHENFIGPQTGSVQVNLYKGSSRNCDKHIFYLKESAAQENGLDGLGDVESRVNKAIAEEKAKLEKERLLKENEELKKEVSELETEVEKLEGQVEQLQLSQSPLNGLLGEVGSSLVESFIKRNPKILASLPGGESLAGLIENEKQALPASSAEDETDVSFSAQPEGGELNEEDRQGLVFVKQLKSHFKPEEFEQVLEILTAFAEDKKQIQTVLQFLQNPSK